MTLVEMTTLAVMRDILPALRTMNTRIDATMINIAMHFFYPRSITHYAVTPYDEYYERNYDE